MKILQHSKQNWMENKMNQTENMSPIVRTLTHAKALIKDRRHWIKDNFATDSKGSVVSPWAERAANFCAIGANRKAAGFWNSEASRKYLAIATMIMTLGEHSHPARFNDYATHEEVMELFDVAIAWAIGAEDIGMEN